MLFVCLAVWRSSDGEARPGEAADAASRAEAFETAATLISFILLGKWLEASDAISRLVSLQPATAQGLLVDCITDVYSEPRAVRAASLVRDDVYKVLPGIQLAAEGVVVRTCSELNHSPQSFRGPMDKAPDYGSGDCQFDSDRRYVFLFEFYFCSSGYERIDAAPPCTAPVRAASSSPSAASPVIR